MGGELGPAGYVDALGLEAHPEGGWFKRMWTHPAVDADGRSFASSIHYLLSAGERSHWHRIDAAELWLWHAGGPLRIDTWTEGGGSIASQDLGPDPTAGEVLQLTVPPHAWQAAEPLGPFALVSCVVVPEFQFEHFELAPPGWSPFV